MLFMNKLEFPSLIDSFVWISETTGVVWFSVRFLYFLCISNCCFYGKKMYLHIIKCNNGKNKLLSKVNKEIMQTMPSPRPLSAVAVEISSQRKPYRWA